MHKYLLIALGGALGSVARFWVGSAVGSRMGARFPMGTLAVNISACIVVGFIFAFLGKRMEIDPTWRYFATIGFIGAYSTFATFEWETLETMRSGAFALAALYSAGSLLLGLGAVWCGARLGEAL